MQRVEYQATLNLKITRVLRAALEAEAWESQQTLSDYVRGLLERRGKWARTTSANRAGGYDLMAEPRPKKEGV